MRRTIPIAASAALVLMWVVPAPASAGDTQATGGTPSMEVQVDAGVEYLVGADGTQYFLDVYRPMEAGPWAVVVMFHGAGGSGPQWDQWISAVAEQGAVVFVPTWADNTPWPSVEAARADFQGTAGQLACSVAFARAEAGTYGGDPSNLTIFGHSAGANYASVIAFGKPKVPKGCVAKSGSVVPENLVLFEGDFLLMGAPFWTLLLQLDPGVMDDLTPWSYLTGAVPFPIRIFVSEIGAKVLRAPLGDPWAEDSWLVLRDPTRVLRSELDELGAFEDRWLDIGETHALLQHHLEALGYEAPPLGVFPKSHHISLSKEGLRLLVDAILQRT